MTFIPALVSLINKTSKTRDYGKKWIANWLISNPKNRVTTVPMDSTFPIVTSLRILFEYPFMAVCDVIQEKERHSLVPIVSIHDTEPSEIYIVESGQKRIIAQFKMKAWRFRFSSLQELEDWMKVMHNTIVSKLKEEK